VPNHLKDEYKFFRSPVFQHTFVQQKNVCCVNIVGILPMSERGVTDFSPIVYIVGVNVFV